MKQKKKISNVKDFLRINMSPSPRAYVISIGNQVKNFNFANNHNTGNVKSLRDRQSVVETQYNQGAKYEALPGRFN